MKSIFLLWICMKQYETVWNKQKTYEYMYELKAEDFALWNLKLITALTWKYDDSFVALTAADLSDASQDDRLSNSLRETECTDAFQQSIDSLFCVAALSSEKVSQFLAELVFNKLILRLKAE